MLAHYNRVNREAEIQDFFMTISPLTSPVEYHNRRAQVNAEAFYLEGGRGARKCERKRTKTEYQTFHILTVRVR